MLGNEVKAKSIIPTVIDKGPNISGNCGPRFCIKRSPTRIINKLHNIYGIVIKPACAPVKCLSS